MYDYKGEHIALFHLIIGTPAHVCRCHVNQLWGSRQLFLCYSYSFSLPLWIWSQKYTKHGSIIENRDLTQARACGHAGPSNFVILHISAVCPHETYLLTFGSVCIFCCSSCLPIPCWNRMSLSISGTGKTKVQPPTFIGYLYTCAGLIGVHYVYTWVMDLLAVYLIYDKKKSFYCIWPIKIVCAAALWPHSLSCGVLPATRKEMCNLL